MIIVPLDGSLEIGLQADFKDKLLSIANGQNPKVVLDFGKVDFIDSACLGILVGFMRKVKDLKGTIAVASLQEDVQSIFQITRLDKVFPLFNSVDEAIASLTVSS